ncbi:biogenesis of lysosome-related organelles complex 1 subunit 2-like [Salvia splendens]|uniref:biogenesis of lysosome-related organelles complex 1 subunit 2-like n=1 Tax=Salvia splendens TaxID=180675 RepID=UPI001C25766E|nr:biogenesis of lysosome-related organelles complex 1 subunit 2-like [Salvia splendens]XP_042062707.1 biogenesis of lysosome-related organelles complex 1 subunit 2-like [Salvia splendens]
MASGKDTEKDQIAASLNDLFTNVSDMIKGELQGTNNVLELLEKMNVRVGEEYKGFGDVASGLRVFVEQLKSKSSTFDDCIQQLDAIEQQVMEFEAVIAMLDRYVSLLESKMQHVYQIPPAALK